MEWDLRQLQKAPLFREISLLDMQKVLDCLRPGVRTYAKNRDIIRYGDKIYHINLLMQGKAQIMRSQLDGSEVLVSTLQANDIFAETLACAQVDASMMRVQAQSECIVMHFSVDTLLFGCFNRCAFHQQLTRNLIAVLAKKNQLLQEKLYLLSKKTTRDKIWTMLEAYQPKLDAEPFVIPMNRQEMADYLSVDRSALSRELSKMQAEGLITYHKQTFTRKRTSHVHINR